jgi:glycosyltransferase involved in cell wall biosynthesis
VEIVDIKILTTRDILFLALLLVVFFMQIYFLLRYYLKLAKHRDSEPTQNSNRISIILSVRNEEQHIREILDKFKAQTFEDYQLLVINVHSEDNTDGVLNALAETNPRLKVTSLSQESQFNEKQIINLGLKGASSPWIIFLTASSGEINANWLANLNGLIAPETELVIAYTNVERFKGFRNLICRLERFNQFIISGAWTLAGKPFVFNQNNVLFKKSMYFDTLGFRHKMNRNYANLELIFNENLKKGKVKITTNPDLTVREHIEDDRGDHIRLLRKGVQIRQGLSWSKKISLFTDDLSRIMLAVISAAMIIIHPEYWLTILSIPVIFILALSIIVKMLINHLNERKIFLSSLVYILIKPLINWWFFWSMYLIHRRSRWN